MKPTVQQRFSYLYENNFTRKQILMTLNEEGYKSQRGGALTYSHYSRLLSDYKAKSIGVKNKKSEGLFRANRFVTEVMNSNLSNEAKSLILRDLVKR